MTRPCAPFLPLLLLSTLLHVPAGAQPAAGPGPLVISEIHFAPFPSTNEFVEILNRSDEPVDLQFVTLADGNLRPDPLVDGATMLPPGERVVAVRDSIAFASVYPDVPFLAPDGWDALNNGGDLVLLQRNGVTLDSVLYDDAWSERDGSSLERIDPAAPSQAFNFASSTDPSGATPGRRNSVFAPDRIPPSALFADVTPEGVVQVLLSEPVAPAALAEVTLTLDGTPISSVRLSSPTVLEIDAPSNRPRLLTIRGIRDRSGNRAPALTIAVARPADAREIAITEIMSAPRADEFDNRPNQVEYVEVQSLTDDLLSLRDWILSDRPREDGTADTITIGRRIGLPPQGRAVIFAAPTDPPDPATESLLAEAFPDAPLSSDAVALLPVDRSSLGLRNDEDVVRVLRSDSVLLETVAYDSDWHADALVDPTGVALERISAQAPAALADNWTSSTAPAGGTPGAPNGIEGDASPAAATGVTVSPSPFSPDEDGGTRIQYTLGLSVSTIRVRIFDARGRLVRSLTDARLSGPTGELVWNGRGDDGRNLRVGIYVVLVDAVDADGGTVERHKVPVVLARPLG